MGRRVLQSSLAVVVFLLAASVPASAFDGSRKGFLLGFGVGPSYSSFKQDLKFQGETAKGERESKAGLATDFKIGYGPSERLLIYYDNKVSWYKSSPFPNISELRSAAATAGIKDVTVVNGASSVGVSYYLATDGQGAYLTGGIGIAAWSTPFESGSSGATGLGVFAGAGYEFAKHWDVEGTLAFGNPSGDFIVEGLGLEGSGITQDTSTISVRVVLNVLGY